MVNPPRLGVQWRIPIDPLLTSVRPGTPCPFAGARACLYVVRAGTLGLPKCVGCLYLCQSSSSCPPFKLMAWWRKAPIHSQSCDVHSKSPSGGHTAVPEIGSQASKRHCSCQSSRSGRQARCATSLASGAGWPRRSLHSTLRPAAFVPHYDGVSHGR